MGLWSGGDSVAMVGSCSGGTVLEAPLIDGGGSVAVRTAPLVGSGGGGGHISHPVSVDSRSASLGPDLGARVLVGLPLGLIRILTICLYASLGGESCTSITSTGSSSSSSLTTATPSSPSLGLGDDNTVRLSATE
jgi:hypothetical protein